MNGTAADATPRLIGLGGLVLDAQDLAATRAFYELLFRGMQGEWQEARGRLTFHSPSQRIEFRKRTRPRTLNHAGQHTAYRVPSERLKSLAQELEASGHPVN